MKPTNVILLAMALAITGTWVRSKTISKPMVIGGAFVTLSIVSMEEFNPELAKQFSWLILATTIGAYGQDVFSMVGNLTTNNNLPDPNDETRPRSGTGGNRPV